MVHTGYYSLAVFSAVEMELILNFGFFLVQLNYLWDMVHIHQAAHQFLRLLTEPAHLHKELIFFDLSVF